MVVDGAATIAGAGLFIHRKRGLLMTAVAGSAALNLLCNFILVPRLGILGAAISTLVGYAGVYVAFAAWGGRYLRVPVPWRTVLRAGAAALVMYVALTFVHSGHRLVTVGVRCLLGGAIYLGLIAALDRDARVLISAIGRKLRARLGQR
jgi:O-antigen/teichoic acid export membrane protein